MKGMLTAILLAGGVISLALPASAQRSSDPNIGHFYMARQQIQITDDAPVVYDKRTGPGAGQQGAVLPSGPAPLPRAGFNAYSSSIPSSMGAGLPEVVNGVPRRLPPPAPSINAKSGKAGAYKVKKATAAPRTSGPQTAKVYTPYKGYGTGNPVAAAPSYSSGGSSSTAVKGSLLHWSRTRRQGY